MSGIHDHGRVLRFSRRAYEGLLFAYPARFRGLYGEEMADLFEEVCGERLADGGTGGLLLFWARALWDLTANATTERVTSLMTMSGYGSVRWGGIMSVMGGLLTVFYGVVVTAVGVDRLARPGFEAGLAPAVPEALMFLYGLGSVMLFGGLVALVRLIERRVQLALPTAGRGNLLASPGRSGRLSWAQRSASVGVAVGVVAASASVILLAKLLIAETTFVTVGPAAGMQETLLAVLGGAKILGLPLATALLGVAAWHSGVLGGWSAFPLVLGLGMSPLGIALLPLLFRLMVDLDGAFGSDLARDLVLFGVPNAVTGLGWALLGWLLFSGRGGDGRELAG